MQPLTVAAVLHRYRVAAGYTQEELAERACISARSISDIERGISKAPHVGTLDGLADALGLSREERAALHAAARGHRSPGSGELTASHGRHSSNGGQESPDHAAVRTAVSLPRFWKPLLSWHVPTMPRRFAVGLPVLVLAAGIAYVATRSTNTPTSMSAARAFVPWHVTRVRPVVLGIMQGFAADRDGNVFVAADTVLPSQTGIWKLAPSGQVLGHWNRHGRDVVHADDIAVDGRGNVYVVDEHVDRVYKLSPRGRWIAEWGSKGTKPGQFIRPGAVAADGEGHVYVGDATGRIQKFSATGSLLATWSNCVPQSANCSTRDMATDTHNNLYTTDNGPMVGIVRKLSPRGRVLAEWTSTGDTPSQPVFDPGEVSFDPQNNVVVPDSYTGGIYKFTSHGRPLHWLQVATHDYLDPFALAIDSKGNAYVTDCCPNTIRKFSAVGLPSPKWAPFEIVPVPLPNPSGIAIDRQGRVIVVTADRLTAVRELSSSGHPVRSWPADVLGLGQAHAPVGLALGTNGHVYVVDALTSRIVELSRSGTVVHPWGTQGSGPGELAEPSAVAVDPSGNLYVTDTGNYRVVKFSPAGKPFRQWGESATFARAQGVALDAEGNVYVADSGTHTIKKLSPDGLLLTQWSGAGRETLIVPTGVAVDARGNVFVTDTGDSRVKEFSFSGNPMAAWGKRGTHSGEFVDPGAIAVDRAGVVWVADTGNNRIQRLSAP
jgi:tripartite motif-containing protein 71